MAGTPAGHDVFLSRSRADAAADTPHPRLVYDHRLAVFIDCRKLAAGRAWQPILEAALADCRAMLVLVGPNGIGGGQNFRTQVGLCRQQPGRFDLASSRSGLLEISG